MNTLNHVPQCAAETAFLAELLADTLALADKIVSAIGATRQERFENGLSPIRLAEIAGDAEMRSGVGAAMDREIARQMAERRAAAAKRTPRKKPAPVANLKPAPFALTPAAVEAIVEQTPRRTRALIEVPIEPIKLVDRPRRSEDPRLAKANDDYSSAKPSSSEPRLGSRAPASIDEAQHCHSLTSADEQTEDAGAYKFRGRTPAARPKLGSRERVAKAVAAEATAAVDRRRVARKFGGGVGVPLPIEPDVVPFDISSDTHERELRRIDRRPPIKTGEHAERRAAQRAAEDAKARRRDMIAAAAEKLRLRRESEAGL